MDTFFRCEAAARQEIAINDDWTWASALLLFRRADRCDICARDEEMQNCVMMMVAFLCQRQPASTQQKSRQKNDDVQHNNKRQQCTDTHNPHTGVIYMCLCVFFPIWRYVLLNTFAPNDSPGPVVNYGRMTSTHNLVLAVCGNGNVRFRGGIQISHRRETAQFLFNFFYKQRRERMLQTTTCKKIRATDLLLESTA